jgi:hypothetical protein
MEKNATIPLKIRNKCAIFSRTFSNATCTFASLGSRAKWSIEKTLREINIEKK